MENETVRKIKEAVAEAEFVLIGIGEEFQAAQGADAEVENAGILEAYNRLAELVKGKTYFVVTQNGDELIFSSSLLDFFISAPMAETNREAASEERWNSYLNWLSATLNHRLCVLELGVGFAMPQMIRWPFEKTVRYNQKSVLIRINEKFPQLPEELAERGYSVRQNAVRQIRELDNGKLA